MPEDSASRRRGVWEHAFMHDYEATERGKCVDAFFKNVDWSVVDHRLREAAPHAASAA